jgi:transaldolase
MYSGSEKSSDILYVKALVAPFRMNTMTERTQEDPRRGSQIGTISSAEGGSCEEVLAQFAGAGVDIDAVAARLQDEGAKSFAESWNELRAMITSNSAQERPRDQNRRHQSLTDPRSSSTSPSAGNKESV